MIKVSKLADYAVVVLSELSRGKGKLLSANAIAESVAIPEPTVAKVLKLLAREQLVDSIRGAHGGYKLSMSEIEMTVADIVRAVDGPIALTACVENSDECCSYESSCPIKGRWDDVNDAIRNALKNVTLAEMITPLPNFIDIQTEDAHEQHI